MNNFHMREGKIEFRWKRWRNKKRQEVSSCLMVLFSGAVLLGAGGVALAGPTGGQVTGGQGTITTPDGTTTNINQQSNVLNINWQDFSIGAGETVNFYQPGSTSVAINRVVGGVPSYLAGALNANGRVFILNSAGITFTGTSQVNVGALLATTAMTVNGDPTQAASYSGSGYGAVINQGSISVSNGGFAILAAPYVQNTGFIKADLGTIALAGTNQFTLDLSGTGLINFVVPAGAVEKIVSDGKAVGVDNSGTLQARSGQVLISANVASEVINAVVNLNGIVDADAFAPNGQGGSVLVTATGDVNVGGQVTARGNGTGAGGQIVTQAGGADNIEQMAFVSAAGGAGGGKGGFIEVSGKTVGLAGNIDPGKGGSLYIDPTNITVIAGTAGGPVGTHIGSDFIENQLAHGIDVTLDACHNITFQALADDHQLVGGSGNFNIVAGDGSGGNIAFLGTNDAIVQGSGFIHMNANGGNIGSAGHAMTLITGVNNTDAGQGVTQAGDIVLKASDDIHVHNVQVKSSGGSSFTAKFSASAGHNFFATGDINVQARAHGTGSEVASATVHIFANNNINLRNVTVVANATENAAGGSDAHALANLDLRAASGSIDVDGNIGVTAFALGAAGGADAQANAVADLDASGDITIHRNVDVSARANETRSTGSSAAACANLEIDGSGSDNVNGHVIVDAFAQGRGHGSVTANAQASIGGTSVDVTINGNIDVSATANHAGTGNAQACANLDLDASSGSLNVNGNIGVHANAQSRGSTGSAWAQANAEVAAEGSGESAQTVNVNGSIDVSAVANQLANGAGGGAYATANLDIDASSGFDSIGHINVNGDITVAANARSNGTGAVRAIALAEIGAGTFSDSGNSTAVDVRVGGNIAVTATANHAGSGAGGVTAWANLDVDASSGSVDIGGNVTVTANAQTNGSGGIVFNAFGTDSTNFYGAAARANAEIAAESGTGLHIVKRTGPGNVTVDGDVEVSAIANVLGTGEAGAALACANLDMDATFSFDGAHGNVNVFGNIGVNALATNLGDGDARANAVAGIDAEGSVLVHGNINVDATANQLNGSSGEEARACANLQINAGGSSGSGSVNVNGDITVSARALGSGTQSAQANAQINIFACDDVNIAGNVAALASANQNGSDGSTAHACANVNLHPAGDVNVNGGVLASANAFSKGSESAVALAAVHINISGDITVNGVLTANAHAIASSTNFSSPNNGALAQASLDINGDPVILGGVDEQVTATSHGSVTRANALANVHLHGASDLIVNGNVTVVAKALDDSSTNGKGATANAHFVANAGDQLSIEGVNVMASANFAGHSHDYSARAIASLEGSRVTVGNTIVRSRASGHSAFGLSKAVLLVTDSAFIHMTGSINVEADLVDFNAGLPSFGAIAGASLNGNSIEVDGPTRVVAKTTGSDAGSIFASALLNVNATKNVHFENTIDVEAHVNGADADGINAHPVAQFNASSLQVDDTLTVLANANGDDAFLVSAVPTLNFHNVAQVTFNGIDVNAHAHGHDVNTVEASASLSYDLHNNFTDHGLTKVVALASGSEVSSLIQADANLFIAVSNNASFGGGIDVAASALQHSTGARSVIANAYSRTLACNHLTFGNDYAVTALASATSASVVMAQALGLMRANANGIDMTTGNVDVAATANGGGNVVGTVAAVASLDAQALGGIHLNGDVNVTANAVYDPNHSHFAHGGPFSASGSTQGNVFALANADIEAGQGDITIDGNIDVSATLLSRAASLGTFFGVLNFGQGSQYLDKTPTALLTIVDHSGGDVNLEGVTVTANEELGYSSNIHFQFEFFNFIGGAVALANIAASDGSVDINGPIDVEASVNAAGIRYIEIVPNKFGLVGALAVLNVDAADDIDAADVTVTANVNIAKVTGFGSAPVIGDAVAIGNFSADDSVDIEGDVSVHANYVGSYVTNEIVIAGLHVNAIDGSATINGDVTVDAETHIAGKFNAFGSDGPPSIGTAANDQVVIANALIEANSGASVTGDFHVGATVQDNGPVKFSVFGGASGEIDGSHVRVGGNFDVQALVNVPIGTTVVADARGGLFGSQGVEVDGSVNVGATAVDAASSFDTFDGIPGLLISRAVFSASASSGAVNIGHGVTVIANTVENASEDIVAFARASANIYGSSGVTVGGAAVVHAELLDRGSNGEFVDTGLKFGPFGIFGPIQFSGAGGLASAQLNIGDDHSAGISLGGLSVTANANVQNPGFGFFQIGSPNASAIASANVISNEGPVNIAGNVIGSALAHDAGWGGAQARTLIDLEPAASALATGSGIGLQIGGNVAMNALADAGTHAEGNVLAIAVLNADADLGGVRIDGNIQLRANAQDLSSVPSHGSAAAYANGHLEGASGVSVGGGMAVLASINNPSNSGSSTYFRKFGGDDAFSFQWGKAKAVASLSASDGGVSVGGRVRASAAAFGRGDSAGRGHLTAATAQVDIEAGDGNIRIGGAVARALASGTDGSNASANANVKLHASSGSINVSPAGITATALAFASFGTHANALGSIAVDADQSIFIRGNVISLAVAISEGNSNTAHAKTHLAGGGATEFGFGPPSSFGNIVVIGNIGAFAAADASQDNATASVEIFAQNNLLIVGNDPIASARVGPSGGTTFAFRQAHVTTNQFASGPGGEATADIDIRAGGFIDVFPPSSVTDVVKLYSLPTDELTLNSSGGLTIIPLAVDGSDCGVLGIAGKDQNAINKALSCHRKPINVSDLTDTGPS